eukprot:1612734-Prymnesium_polylepis.1
MLTTRAAHCHVAAPSLDAPQELDALRLLLSYRRQLEGAAADDERGGWRPPVAIPNVDALPLTLGEFVLHNRFYARTRLLKMLGGHYQREVLRQVHRILLHTDISGYVAGKMVSLSGDAQYEVRAARRLRPDRDAALSIAPFELRPARAVALSIAPLESSSAAQHPLS